MKFLNSCNVWVRVNKNIYYGLNPMIDWGQVVYCTYFVFIKGLKILFFGGCCCCCNIVYNTNLKGIIGTGIIKKYKNMSE